MNANRMKYSTTPTYGMQKRGFLKRPQQSVRQAPETPDFSQVPEQPASIQQPFAQQPAPAPMFTQPVSAPGPSMPFMGQPIQPTAQIPFAMPSFVPTAGSAPFSTMQQPPLGNSAPVMNPQNPFSLRGQGYVPPARSQAAPNVQTAAFAAQPFARQQQPVMPPFSSGVQSASPVGQMPPSQPGFMSFAPAAPAQAAQPVFSPQAAAPAAQKPARKSINANQLLSVFLFGLLPLLFIPCIFLSSSFDFLRYAFMALSVAGLGAMWYRQSYAPVTRLIVSMVYVALCVVCIAMMMQGVQDNRRTASGLAEPASAVQATEAPAEEQPLAAAVPTEEEPTPTPEAMSASRAQQRLETFMTLWEGNNVTEMVNLVQPSWASTQENRSTALFMLLANRTPEDFTIEEVGGTEQDSSRTITMTATINKNNGKTPTVYRFMVMMVKEGEDWYVNPNSLATNDEVSTASGSDDENVVNNKNAGGLATEPPRTTVTPAPPASTTLYYNPNGGSYYHLDAYCPSVKEEYLPLTGTFSYRELGEYKSKGLLPCMKCSAPVNTLPPEQQ